MTDPAIRLRGVSKRYGTQLALETTTMDIEEGEFFCLLGPSGCGKTTTLNLIGGFVAPTAGEIWIRGERVEPDEGEGLLDPAAGVALGCAGHLQAEADVVPHRHVREERVVLEDRVHRPPVGREPVDVLTPDQDVARRRRDEPTDEVERGRLPATRRTKQAEELAFRDLEIRRLERVLAAVTLRHAAEGDSRRIRAAQRDASG